MSSKAWGWWEEISHRPHNTLVVGTEAHHTRVIIWTHWACVIHNDIEFVKVPAVRVFEMQPQTTQHTYHSQICTCHCKETGKCCSCQEKYEEERSEEGNRLRLDSDAGYHSPHVT
ncbi:hypothetical protein Ancab_020427 [Ancistrocladus abbreviatus]